MCDYFARKKRPSAILVNEPMVGSLEKTNEGNTPSWRSIMGFKVSTIAAGTITPTTKDGRTAVQEMFANWNGAAPEGQRLEPLEVVALDCTNGSPGDLGFKGDNGLKNCIPLLLNYKSGVDAFKGKTKGKTLVILGGQRGFRSPNMMIERGGLREMATYLNGLADALDEAEQEQEANVAADALTGE